MSDYPEQGNGPGHTAGGQPVSERAARAGERAGQAVHEAERRSRTLRMDLSRGIERTRILAAEGLARAANSLRGSATTPESTAYRFAEGLDRSANYLRQTDLAGMRRDAIGLVRQYPIQAIGAAFVVGLIIGQRLSGDD